MSGGASGVSPSEERRDLSAVSRSGWLLCRNESTGLQGWMWGEAGVQGETVGWGGSLEGVGNCQILDIFQRGVYQEERR